MYRVGWLGERGDGVDKIGMGGVRGDLKGWASDPLWAWDPCRGVCGGWPALTWAAKTLLCLGLTPTFPCLTACASSHRTSLGPPWAPEGRAPGPRARAW